MRKTKGNLMASNASWLLVTEPSPKLLAAKMASGRFPFFRHNIYPGAITIDLIGVVNQGNLVLPLSHNPTNPLGSWNLVGNPYPSTVYWDDQVTGDWTKVNISNAIVIRDNGRDNGALGAPRFLYWNGLIGDENFQGEIAAGQAFWVETLASSPQLTITENAKVPTTGEFFRKAEPDALIATINRSGYNGYDRAYLQLHDDAKLGLDFLDGSKMANDHFDLFTQTEASQPLAINAFDKVACGTSMVLGLRFTKNSTGGFVLSPQGSYALNFETKGTKFEGYTLTLHDTYLNTKTPITSGTSYSFTISSDAASYQVNRFLILFDGKVVSPPVVSAGFTCQEGSVTLKAIQEEGAIIEWYADETSISPIYTGPEYNTEVLDVSTQFFVSATDESGCKSDRVSVMAEVHTLEKATISLIDEDVLQSNYPDVSNTWYLNGTILSENSFQLEATESGVYRVEISLGGCTVSAEKEFIISGNENSNDNGFMLFPNPANKQISLSNKNGLEVKQIRILNAMGQDQKLPLTKIAFESDKILIDIGSLTSGSYLLQVVSPSGKKDFRFIKVGE